MFKLQKHKSYLKSTDKFQDFKFSDFQAIKVPKGWDKLFVSLVSVETGKTAAKSGKTSVRNGTCSWTETFCESINISEENEDSKEPGGCFYKFVVAMGSSRSGILGEVSIDLANFASSRSSTPLTLQLKKCQYGTSLQFKVQCLTPKTKYRDAEKKGTNLDIEYVNSDNDDVETKSDASDSAFSRSIGSTSSSHLESGSISQSAHSRDPSFSASDARHSSDSLETSSPKDVFSSQNNFLRAVNTGEQEATDSQTSSSSSSFLAVSDGNRSLKSSFHSRIPEALSPYGNKKEQNSSAIASSPLSNTGPSKQLLEAAEVTVEELRAEVRMWERNSKKLTVDVDLLKNEVSEQSRNQNTLSMELSASQQECYGFQQEIEHLKGLLEKSAKKQETTEDIKIRAMEKDEIRMQMEDEIQFLKESNANLTGQLEKTQESNIELLSILQELEGIVETQKSEIENLSSQKMKLQESVNLGLNKDLELNIVKGMQPMQVPDDKIPLGIDSIKLQLQQLQETQEELESAIHLLEKTVEEKDNEIERLQDFRAEALLDFDSTWLLKVAGKEEEIRKLEEKLSEAVKNCQNIESEVSMGNESQMVREIDSLRRKVDNLEKDCNELTEENLELILKLKARDPSEPEQDMSSTDVESQFNELEIQLETSQKTITHLEDELQKFHVQMKGQQLEINALQQQLMQCGGNEIKTGNLNLSIAESISEDDPEEQQCKQELGYWKSALEVGEVKSENSQKEEEIEGLLKKISTLEDQIASTREENQLLVESIESLEREKALSSESVGELKKEIVDLSSSVESHVSASKKLQRLSSELEKGKQDIEQQLSELETENMQMSERISALEAQLRYLTNEKETCYLELRHSEAQLVNLRDEIRRLETEMEAQKVDLKQRLEDMRSRWLEAQEECEYLKKANPKLESTAENLIEECNSLQKVNAELKRQNMEMHTRCSVLESQLRDSKGRFYECSEKIETLESEFSNMLEEVSLKEAGLNSELDSLIVEDKEQKEKLIHEHISLNDMYSQKVFEVENLQRELAHLIDQISVVDDEKETPRSHSILELSVLHADKAKLEASLFESQGKLAFCQSKLSRIESETETKFQALTRELTASRKNEEALMADCDNLSVLLESVKSNAEKYKSNISKLDINLKASEYERKQLDKEVSNLKGQMQRASLLQDELLAVKTYLSDARFEHERMKASLELVRGDYEDLKTEKNFLVQKVSNMEKAVLELEDCQRGEIALQEKVLRLEGDLAAKEALCAQDAELKFELSRIRRGNSELQRKIKHLEQDQQGFIDRIHSLEEQLKQKIQTAQDIKSSDNPSDLVDAAVATITVDLSKFQTLENQLAEALEANDMYKDQLRRFLSEEENNRSDSEIQESNLSRIELELRDLRERYFEMSLKYAEVEAQREELVLKLKSRNNKKSWFSK